MACYQGRQHATPELPNVRCAISVDDRGPVGRGGAEESGARQDHRRMNQRSAYRDQRFSSTDWCSPAPNEQSE